MEKNMSQLISVEEMLDVLFDRADTSENRLVCCKCFVENRKFIVAMALSDSSANVFIYNTEDNTYFIDVIASSEEWDDADKRISDFFDCSNQNGLIISEYAENWYSRLEPNSNIISNSIKQKRSFFICCYPETFENHYNPMDETGEIVLLITEFSDDFSSVHFYVHFLGTDTAFLLSEDTNAPDLVWNLYCKFCDNQEKLQISGMVCLNC